MVAAPDSHSYAATELAERYALRARWVFPVSGPPLQNATVEVTGGRISAVWAGPEFGAYNVGNSAIIPGLVNAHTHLELSDMAFPLSPSRPFTTWLREVIRHRRDRAGRASADIPSERAAEDLAAQVRRIVDRGLAESCGSGTTTIGDIAGPESSSAPRPRRVAFLELLGLASQRVEEQLHRGREHLADDSSVIRGLSPHAPYSVHPDLFRGLVDLAVARRAPIAMHLAETREELQLLAHGTGEFVPFLEALGVWQPEAIPRGSRPLDYLRELARADSALAVHGNYLAPDEIEFLTENLNISVVYCPRTHAFFGHAAHPWRTLLERGVNVALGTDSRASNPDLSLWNELLFLRQESPDFDCAGLLKLGTSNGALALGLGHDTGTLDVGKSADLAIVELVSGDSTDPYALLFNPGSRVARAMSGGEWLN
jgi:cytosine/adenosine deaminase-related metal-dependent hydrolase